MGGHPNPTTEILMSTYIVLINFTDQGIQNLHETTRRADSFVLEAEKAGARVKTQFWTVGAHDGVVILDAPDHVTAAALVLSLGSHGSVRTQLLRAFDRAEIDTLLAKIG